eukprot:TRINITY_DN21887_c0_g1_i1.p1 TRINITY_DN21887_c0_g1~~TRINITY_DN21887_c0_g1_i1.p1  ORF type:complete len:595 (-),score=53.89 TRINITY_DN21887_c0_g1_i1:442-2226(-)
MLSVSRLPLASIAPSTQLPQASLDRFALPPRLPDQNGATSKRNRGGSPFVTMNSTKANSCFTTRQLHPSPSCSTCSSRCSPYTSSCSSETGSDDCAESMSPGCWSWPRPGHPNPERGGAPMAVPQEDQGSSQLSNASVKLGEDRRRRVILTLQKAGDLMREQINIVDQLLQRPHLRELDAAQKRASALQHQQESARNDLCRMAAEARDLLRDMSKFQMPALREMRDRLASSLRRSCHAGLARKDSTEVARCRRAIQSAIDDRRGKVRICCRIRPLIEEGHLPVDEPCVRAVDDTTVEMQGGETFTFNSVFSPGTQEEVFEDTRDLINAAIDGRNVTILSYGPTGSGKTHTLFGSPDGEQDGIAFRAGAELFKGVVDHSRHADASVSISMLELYNNRFTDLLGLGGRSETRLDFARRSDASARVSMEGVVALRVRDVAEFHALLLRGLAQRVVRANPLNTCSSRSHLIVTISVDLRDRQSGRMTTGMIRICDLAGSERLKRTKADGVQQIEAIEINKSLTALGNVIQSVVAGRKVVPYRNHKLTRLLHDSLGAASRTLMVVSCSQQAASANETLTALKYACRAGKITSSVSAMAS